MYLPLRYLHPTSDASNNSLVIGGSYIRSHTTSSLRRYDLSIRDLLEVIPTGVALIRMWHSSMASFNALLSSMSINVVLQLVLSVTLLAKALTSSIVLLNRLAIVIELALSIASSTITEVAAPPAPRTRMSLFLTSTSISRRDSTNPAPSVV